jgi:hypothetical protein
MMIMLYVWPVTEALAQQKFTLSGHIKDAASGEALIGASVFIEKTKTGTSSNSYGFYSLTLPGGSYDLRIFMQGYSTVSKTIDLTSDKIWDVELNIKPLEVQGTIVTAESPDENIRLPEMSSIRLTPSQVKTIPILMGEQDILKTIQLTPGVQAAAEGNTGFFVRGGAADQNLILLDEATVYNAAHLMGFFSVFNSDAIKDAELFKGSSSAEYGGRLSSVLDLKMREGNTKKFAGAGGIGLIASRLLIEGPIKKDKASFFIAARRTYFDLFLKTSSKSAVRKSSLYFYDLNAKANYLLGKNDRLFLSGYFGKDVLGYKGEFGIDWGNATGTIRWNHIYSNKLFSNTSFITSLYSYKVGLSNGDELVEIYSSIMNYSLKQDFQYFSNSRNTFKFGLQAFHHNFVPGKITTNKTGSINDLQIRDKHAFEGAAYLNHEFKATDLLTLDYGIRYSMFAAVGPGEEFTFDQLGNPTSYRTYRDGELIKYYGGIEPRATISYMLDDVSSVKASYARNRQYLHLLSTSTTSTPFDLWHPSTKIVKPGIADQYAIGYFRNFEHDKYEMSAELYYKNLKNQIDYKNGADIFFNQTVESELVFGKGRSYGLELYGKKKYGRLNGWFSYTLSRTQNKFAAINDGAWFRARQDRTHNFDAVMMYDLSSTWSFSAAWVYMTGNAVTFPVGKYGLDDHVINLYSSRNGYRMPAYHRLDLGWTWKSKRSSWNLSLYNAYGRKNAYAIQFRTNEDDPTKTEAVRVALFSFFPSATYNFAF